MSPTDKFPVTLEAQAWETVMRVLSEAPYRIVAPLIGEIQSQCMRQQAEAKRSTSPAPFNRAAWAGAESEE
jgi:hypothetical protein